MYNVSCGMLVAAQVHSLLIMSGKNEQEYPKMQCQATLHINYLRMKKCCFFAFNQFLEVDVKYLSWPSEQ